MNDPVTTPPVVDNEDPSKDPEFAKFLETLPEKKPVVQDAAPTPAPTPAPVDQPSEDALPDLSFHYDPETEKRIRGQFKQPIADALLSGDKAKQKETLIQVGIDDPYMAAWARTKLDMNESSSFSPSVMSRVASGVKSAERSVHDAVLNAPENIVMGASDALDNSIKFGTMVGNLAFPEDVKVDTKNVTVFGQSHEEKSFVRDATAFTAGFLGAGKLLGASKFLTASPIIKAALAAGIGSAVTTDATPESRLTDLLESYPHLQNTVTDFLAANVYDKDGKVIDSKHESEAMGRLRNGLENTLAGPVVDKLVGIIGGVAKWAIGKVKPGTPQAAAIEAEIAQKIQAADAPQVTPEVTPQVTPAAPAPTPIVEPKAAPEVPLTPGPVISKEASDKILAAAQNGVSPEDSLRHVNINVPKMTDSVTVANVLHQTALELPEGALAGPKFSLEQNAKEAASLLADVTPQQFIDGLSSLAGEAQKLPKYLVAARMIMAHKAGEIGDLSKTLIGPGRSPEAEAAFLSKIDEYHALSKPFSEAQAGGARGVTSGNTKVEPTAHVNQGDVYEAARKTGLSPEQAEKVAKIAAISNGDWKITAKLAATWHKSLSVFNEVYINAILSGPKTFFANLAGAVTIAGQPVEKMLGGAMMAAAGKQGGKDAFLEGMQHLASLHSATWDVISAMKKGFDSPVMRSLRDEAGVLDKTHLTVDTPHAISAANLLPEGLQGATIGSTVDWMGKIIRLPTRLMTTSDELMKQINYRAFVSARGTREGIVKGFKGQDLDNFVQDYTGKAYDETGAGTHAAALFNSQKATFTNPLLPDTLGSGISSLASKHPLVRTLIPFIRTPTNIIRGVGQRTLLTAPLYKEFRQDIAAGGFRASEALGKLAMGTTFYTAAITLAANEMITGGGPADPTLKKQKMATGWQPYSVKSGDTYSAFNRLDPVGMFFGLAADFHEVSGQVDDSTALDTAGHMTLSLMRNLSSKTYLQGLTSALDALSKPETAGKRFLQGIASGAVPFSGLSKTFNKDENPYQNDVRTLMDSVRASIPGYGATLPPRRDIVGDKVAVPSGLGSDMLSPVATSVDIHDSVRTELARLNHAFEIPNSKVGNVDLRDFPNKEGQSAYDRYQELVGQVNHNGIPIKEGLKQLIESPKYKELGTDDMPAVGQGSRVSDVQVLLQKYREKALKQTIEEYPQLKQQLGLDKSNKKDLKHDRVDQIIKLNK